MIKSMLVNFVSTKKQEWSKYIDTCVFAYNTSRRESTKFTPFEIMFNQTGFRYVYNYYRSESTHLVDAVKGLGYFCYF